MPKLAGFHKYMSENEAFWATVMPETLILSKIDVHTFHDSTDFFYRERMLEGLKRSFVVGLKLNKNVHEQKLFQNEKNVDKLNRARNVKKGTKYVRE